MRESPTEVRPSQLSGKCRREDGKEVAISLYVWDTRRKGADAVQGHVICLSCGEQKGVTIRGINHHVDFPEGKIEVVEQFWD